MSQQKINNLQSLDSLAGLPDEIAADITVLWQKLEDRLQKKPRRSKAVWYWAAACIISALSVPFFVTEKKPAENTAIKTQPKNIIPDIIIPQEIKSEIVIAAPVKNNEIKTTIINHEPLLKKNTVIVSPKVVNSFTALAPAELRNIPAVNISPSPDTALLVKTTAAPKKKLSVVHFNELEDEDKIASQTANTARRVQKRPGKTGGKTEYAGTFNFRIYLKN